MKIKFGEYIQSLEEMEKAFTWNQEFTYISKSGIPEVLYFRGVDYETNRFLYVRHESIIPTFFSSLLFEQNTVRHITYEE